MIHVIPAQGQQPPTAGPPGGAPGAPPGAPGSPPGAPEAPPGLPPIAPAEPGAPVSPPSPAEQAPPPQAPAPQPRPYPQEPPPTPAPPPPTPGAPPAPPGTPPPPDKKDLASRIADEKQLRQSADQQIQILALQFQATRCNQEDVLAGNYAPKLPLVTCSHEHKESTCWISRSSAEADQRRRLDTLSAERRGSHHRAVQR